jgi:hypothetical protein
MAGPPDTEFADSGTARSEHSGVGGGLSLAIWLLLAVAFTPVGLDLVRHWVAHPWALYSVVFFGLFAWDAVRADADRPRPLPGLTLVAVALLVEAVLVAEPWTRWARPALALGMIGVARTLGRPPWRYALLALWAIPVPTALMGPGLYILERLVSATPLGATQPLGPEATGLPLAALLSGLAWHAALREGREIAAAARFCAIAAGAGLAIQAAFLATALFGGSLGAPAFASGVLRIGPWVAAGLLCGGWVWRQRTVARGLPV